MFALPSNENREKAVIGAILIDQDYFEAASEIVSASDFYHVRPKICWEVMEKLHGRGDEIDAITLYAEIDKQAKRDLVSVSFPNECMNCVAVPSHVGTYAQDVKRLSQRRSIIVAAHETAEQAETADDLDAVAGHASDRLRTIAMDNVQHETPLVGTDVDEALEDATRVGTPEGLVKTGIPEFDSKYAGLWPGLLTVLASRPSMGKSMFALNVVTNAALAGHPVCLVSLEDTRRFVQWRIMARLGDVRLQSIVERSLDDTDRQRLAKAAETMKGLPLYIEDGAGLTSAKIRNLITSQHRTRKYELIVIDHLAHIREPGLDKYQSITQSAETIEGMIKELNVPNLLIHQLNRETEKDGRAGPQLHHLRSSGEVEQLARVVLFLNRDSYHDREADPNELTLRIAKNSHGPIGDLDLWCDLPRMFVGERKRVEF